MTDWVVIGWLAAVSVAVGALAWRVRPRRTAVPAEEPASVARHGNDQLQPPPMIDGVTLRDWLVHHHPHRDHVWSSVVSDFYTRAGAVPVVADYFRNTNMDQLQRHFTRALIMVTHTGVTRGMVARISERHRDVRASDGKPITSEIYDAVISTLVGVLVAHGVPNRGIQALATTIGPFRAALVKE